MKSLRVMLFVAGLSFASVSLAAPSEHWGSPAQEYLLKSGAVQSFGIGHEEYMSLNRHPLVQQYVSGQFDGHRADRSDALDDPMADYETFIPRGSQPEIDSLEKYVLTAYLDNPSNQETAAFLGMYHIIKALSTSGEIGSYGELKRAVNGEIIRHMIVAQYFLLRAEELGSNEKWIGKAIKRIEKYLEGHGKTYAEISTDEGHPANAYFIEALNYKEENRFSALDMLLNDYAKNPGNLMTIFQITSLNLWIGGEADYDDPTILYNFVVGGWFSVKAMMMAKDLQQLAESDPSVYQPFRMANILGGMSVLQRRWLAKLHGNEVAVSELDDEHRAWFDHYPAFHSFTIGTAYFEEEENFEEGMTAWNEGFAACQLNPEYRTCQNRPRFSFNSAGMMVGQVDFLLKSGELDLASQFLTWLQFDPNYPEWDLGHAAIEHRIDNLVEIFDRYQNDDIGDDPTHFMLKKRKWGSSTGTCQTCHQVQSKSWTEEEKASIIVPPDAVLYFDWPAISTTWYGSFSNFR